MYLYTVCDDHSIFLLSHCTTEEAMADQRGIIVPKAWCLAANMSPEIIRTFELVSISCRISIKHYFLVQCWVINNVDWNQLSVYELVVKRFLRKLWWEPAPLKRWVSRVYIICSWSLVPGRSRKTGRYNVSRWRGFSTSVVIMTLACFQMARKWTYLGERLLS